MADVSRGSAGKRWVLKQAWLTFTNKCALSRSALLSAVGSPARTVTMLTRRRSVTILALSIESRKSPLSSGVSDMDSTISCMRSHVAGADSTAASIEFRASLSTKVLIILCYLFCIVIKHLELLYVLQTIIVWKEFELDTCFIFYLWNVWIIFINVFLK